VNVANSPYDTPKEPIDMPCIAYPPDTTPELGEKGVVLQFSVKDEGIGVPANRLGAIFDTFTQVDHSTTRVYGGTGLGLAICKQIVQLMGGTISVRSKQGVGSIFSFTLPTHQYTLPSSVAETTESPKADRVQPLVPEKSGNGTLTDASKIAQLNVLVAEDNIINQKVIGKMLTNLACKFNVVSDGAEAIAACKQTQYDVVLMDLHMPNIDGWKAAEIIKQQPAPPIIFATTAALFHEADYERLKTCMDGYLVKPVSLVRVKQLLHDVATKHPYPRWT
jgi:CheY-like chemotaxis protein